ncbi:MAG: MoaD/ThiS family protein [Planctomycetaceae bacterium]|jgi:molybdopterin converting factor small subunit|nr:MoaD/ThiS family protein [Planctomycetaceae bacterium]MBT6154713.1 MoaD/ThiS family protein [Planctomycetaceae bacterium]MBT6485887.1 MoaD/ThiS family protein [Planctomycetaceae bacterium]MBT6493459.1 MoaD/ThiS family protein [Planctomycetaceae bacterium]
MQVTIEFAAQLKRAAGTAAETIDVETGCAVQELVAEVAERHGDPLSGLLLGADGALHPSILLFVSDEQVRWETPRALCDNDVVTLLSPISGG